MKYIDYIQLNPFQKFGYKCKNFFVNLPHNLAKFFIMIGNFFKRLFLGIGHGFANFGKRFAKGDWATKLSYLIMGMGNISKGQYIKGLLFLVIEAAYAMFLIFFGIDQLSQFGTLGTQEGGLGIDPTTGAYGYVEGDNSMLILLYGVTTIVVSVVFLVFYIMNTKSAIKVQELKAEGKHIPTFKEELKQFGDEKFHITLLSLPCLLIGVFTVLPLSLIHI